MMKSHKAFFTSFIQGILNSYAQVFFSDHRLFAVILVLVSFFDLYAGISGLLSVVISNSAAFLIGFNRTYIRSGYYGFNNLLVGLGLGIFYQPSVEFYLLLFFTSLLTLLLTVMLEGVIGKYYLPYLSIPFLLGIWMVLLASRHFASLDISERGIYMLNEMYTLGGLNMVRVYEWFIKLPLPESLIIYFRSLGAIFFQHHLFSGILIALGLLIFSRIAFVLSLVGYYLAYLFYHIFGGDLLTMNYSYIGFNFILTSIAVGGYFIIPSRYSYLWVVLLTPLTVIVILSTGTLFSLFQLSIYSLPFNIVVLVFLYVLKFRERHFRTPQLVEVQQFSPEKNLYAQLNYSSRFDPSLISLALPVWGEWTVTQGHSGEITHKDEWRHAWDFELEDEEGNRYRGKGDKPEDFHAYGKPVTAPADGWVEQVLDGVEDNKIGEIDTANNWGNTLILRHEGSVFSMICHLKKGSFKVKAGDQVKKGAILAQCGSSGRSPVPHIHFQVQRTPYIGAPTIPYPFSNLIHHDRLMRRLMTWSFPGKGEKVSNIDKNAVLEKAFHFIPGQTISLEISENGKIKRNETLHVEIDMMNNHYIRSAATGARAYFNSDGPVFYFTGYSGSKHSALYYFFLAHFKVVKGFYPGMTIEDGLPLHLFHSRSILFLQDLLAPFVIFIRSSYRLTYQQVQHEFSDPLITLHSLCEARSFNATVRSLSFDIRIREKGITGFTIHEKDKTVEVKCH